MQPAKPRETVVGLYELLLAADCAEQLELATVWCVDNGIKSIDSFVRLTVAHAEFATEFIAHLELKRGPSVSSRMS